MKKYWPFFVLITFILCCTSNAKESNTPMEPKNEYAFSESVEAILIDISEIIPGQTNYFAEHARKQEEAENISDQEDVDSPEPFEYELDKIEYILIDPELIRRSLDCTNNTIPDQNTKIEKNDELVKNESIKYTIVDLSGFIPKEADCMADDISNQDEENGVLSGEGVFFGHDPSMWLK